MGLPGTRSRSKMSTKRNLNGQVSESYYSYIYVGRKLKRFLRKEVR